MPRSRRAAAIALALAAFPAAGQEVELTVRHGISAFGPLKYGPDFEHFDYVVPGAPQGGELSFRGTGASRTFDSLNQFILQGEPAQGLERLYDSLLVASADEPDAAYGQIAESVAYPEDRAFAIYTMRPEARFTDGHPITAEDVVWTLRKLKAQGSPTYRIQLQDVAAVEALGAHRVRVDFAEGAQIFVWLIGNLSGARGGLAGWVALFLALGLASLAVRVIHGRGDRDLFA